VGSIIIRQLQTASTSSGFDHHPEAAYTASTSSGFDHHPEAAANSIDIDRHPETAANSTRVGSIINRNSCKQHRHRVGSIFIPKQLQAA
jgi:hypothetical protein